MPMALLCVARASIHFTRLIFPDRGRGLLTRRRQASSKLAVSLMNLRLERKRRRSFNEKLTILFRVENGSPREG